MPAGLQVIVVPTARQGQIRMIAEERVAPGRVGAIPAFQKEGRPVDKGQTLIELEDVGLWERSNHDQRLRRPIEKCLMR